MESGTRNYSQRHSQSKSLRMLAGKFKKPGDEEYTTRRRPIDEVGSNKAPARDKKAFLKPRDDETSERSGMSARRAGTPNWKKTSVKRNDEEDERHKRNNRVSPEERYARREKISGRTSDEFPSSKQKISKRFDKDDVRKRIYDGREYSSDSSEDDDDRTYNRKAYRQHDEDDLKHHSRNEYSSESSDDNLTSWKRKALQAKAVRKERHYASRNHSTEGSNDEKTTASRKHDKEDLRKRRLRPSREYSSGSCEENASWNKKSKRRTKDDLRRQGRHSRRHSSGDDAPSRTKMLSKYSSRPEDEIPSRKENSSRSEDDLKERASEKGGLLSGLHSCKEWMVREESGKLNPKPASQRDVCERDPTDEGRPDEQPVLLSEAEMNQLGAKLVRAELLGNEELAAKLKSRMEAARQAKSSVTSDPPPSSQRGRRMKGIETEEEVVLMRTNRAGQSWPVTETCGGDTHGAGRRKNKHNIMTHDTDGQRERYFGDDDQHDLMELVRKERMTSSSDHVKLFSKVTCKAIAKLSDHHTLDDMFISKAAKESDRNDASHDRDAAIQQHRKMMASVAKCRYCLDSAEMKRHLIVELGTKVYICLPSTQSLAEGHCLVIPMQHKVASTALDEDVWAEVKTYRKAITKMFRSQSKDVIFLETCMNAQGMSHMTIECIPVDKELGDVAPLYFKKAIQECETEWSQNKKLVDITRKRDIRRSVPQGFPYFSVVFGQDGGFAHVIEDQDVFPYYFGKEIIGGMLDIEPFRWRKPHRQNFDEQSQKVIQFGTWWKAFQRDK